MEGSKCMSAPIQWLLLSAEGKSLFDWVTRLCEKQQKDKTKEANNKTKGMFRIWSNYAACLADKAVKRVVFIIISCERQSCVYWKLARRSRTWPIESWLPRVSIFFFFSQVVLKFGDISPPLFRIVSLLVSTHTSAKSYFILHATPPCQVNRISWFHGLFHG